MVVTILETHRALLAPAAPKADKDRLQAFQLLAYLQDERPGDIALAAEDLRKRGPGWTKRVRQEMAKLPRPIQELADSLATAK